MAESPPLEVAARFAALSRLLHGLPSRERTLRRVVDLAVTTVPGSEHAGFLSLRRGGGAVGSEAHTGGPVPELARVQERLGEGPVPAPQSGEPVVRIADTAEERRWPRFARHAEELGVRALLACTLTGERGTLGTLCLCSAKPEAFDETAVRTAAVFGEHAAVALDRAGQVDSLETAVASRQLIGEATGMLMERYGVASPQAFGMLVRCSQHLNVKLREVASRIVEGQLADDRIRHALARARRD
ncbi:GAF and ANTAR domain-containing protein [Streptomyces sp. JJ36]|uniref:GAF and ANTAR domain-containing protein n=1 Tax=Streptomyces sp. JJ36 TaxID=2736645 RepID=UPI001F2F6D8B|nr:GAF and ANTAR domain-containing protein [Streptomyces sp. JJ36]MCF6522845.1 GAF and ANTAR domain-containing protein [Streptomyces sp. JJ36]